MEQSLELVAATLFLVCQINEGLRALTQSGFIESSRTARQDENVRLLSLSLSLSLSLLPLGLGTPLLTRLVFLPHLMCTVD